ncbi:polycomb protein suz12-B [Schistocerca cancellata]|uniref:polycomb protein suz12-B n=1 Tax=Schistocerca cancellata TaxID=274614 RepID=UPI00211811F2|nr:polycomb protein suz12-B [Schistocerca cancellata]
MPPKKREKDTDISKNPRMDQIQADHELFLQAFEKPTQIYRFLRTRNMLSPVFLNRTLSYMKQRMSRTNKSRKNFSVDNLMDMVVKRNKESIQPEVMRGYMTLTFLGFYDKKVEAHHEPVKVETLLLKICHKKRKDVSSPFMQVSVGTSEVAINPSEDQPPPKAPTVSIPTESFSLSNGHLVKSYMLLLRVSCNSVGAQVNDTDVLEPAQKRRKSSGPAKAQGQNQPEEVKLYGAELVVYDKHNRCLLTDGDYELILQEVQASVRQSPKKHSSWEAIGDVKEDTVPFQVFSKGPTLKFRLNWTTEPSNGLVDRPKPIRPHDQCLDSNSNKENRPERCNNSTKVVAPIKKEPRLQIVYQFLYNNNSRQQTEACEDLTCPWCSLDCVVLYALLKHLKLCHSRFTFTYVPIPQGARIDVAINECYDGSYTGSPHDLISQPPGFAFSRNGPVRRTAVSNILVCRPKRPKPSLSEFLELDENEFDGQRPYITGHNRLYHHTTTCLPIYPKEMDVDSEGEHDPKWLQTKTMMMIDEFTDVNEGEKELMKMWNLHVMKHGYVGDCQIPLACTMFLQAKGKELLQKNLYRNFVLHMCSLFDFGLVSPVTHYTTIQRLQELISESGDVRNILQESWQTQRKMWELQGAAGGEAPPTPRRKSPPKTATAPASSQSGPSVSSHQQLQGGIASPHQGGECVPRRKSPPAGCPAPGQQQGPGPNGGNRTVMSATNGSHSASTNGTSQLQAADGPRQRRSEQSPSASTLPRRKSAADSSTPTPAHQLPQRRKSVGPAPERERRRSPGKVQQQPQSGCEPHPPPPPPPARRKSLGLSVANGNILTTHNGQSPVGDAASPTPAQQQRRKLQQAAGDTQNHLCS